MGAEVDYAKACTARSSSSATRTRRRPAAAAAASPSERAHDAPPTATSAAMTASPLRLHRRRARPRRSTSATDPTRSPRCGRRRACCWSTTRPARCADDDARAARARRRRASAGGPAPRVFLGLRDGDAPGSRCRARDRPTSRAPRRSTCARAAARWPAFEATAFAQARALLHWQQRHRYLRRLRRRARRSCAPVGSARCAHCGTEHYPRTDPAIIVAVSDGERLLLGRQAAWPPRRWSVLAGFVEPGESLEQTVVREVLEETGVRVRSCRYARFATVAVPRLADARLPSPRPSPRAGRSATSSRTRAGSRRRATQSRSRRSPSPRLSISRWADDEDGIAAVPAASRSPRWLIERWPAGATARSNARRDSVRLQRAARHGGRAWTTSRAMAAHPDRRRRRAGARARRCRRCRVAPLRLVHPLAAMARPRDSRGQGAGAAASACLRRRPAAAAWSALSRSRCAAAATACPVVRLRAADAVLRVGPARPRPRCRSGRRSARSRPRAAPRRHACSPKARSRVARRRRRWSRPCSAARCGAGSACCSGSCCSAPFGALLYRLVALCAQGEARNAAAGRCVAARAGCSPCWTGRSRN